MAKELRKTHSGLDSVLIKAPDDLRLEELKFSFQSELDLFPPMVETRDRDQGESVIHWAPADIPSAGWVQPMVDVRGYEKAFLAAVNLFINMLKEKNGTKPKKRSLCILIFGPPGSGKTTWSRKIAGNLAKDNFGYIEIDTYSLFFGKYKVDDMRRYLRKKVEIPMTEMGKSAVFVDEIDFAAPQRNDLPQLSKLFLALVNRLMRRRNPVFVVFATNDIESVDETIRRDIDFKIYMPPPTRQEAIKILETLEAKEPAKLATDLCVGYYHDGGSDKKIPRYTNLISALIKAKVASKMKGYDNLDGVSWQDYVEEVANNLGDLIDRDNLRHFEERNEELIDEAERNLRYLIDLYDKSASNLAKGLALDREIVGPLISILSDMDMTRSEAINRLNEDGYRAEKIAEMLRISRSRGWVRYNEGDGDALLKLDKATFGA